MADLLVPDEDEQLQQEAAAEIQIRRTNIGMIVGALCHVNEKFRGNKAVFGFAGKLLKEIQYINFDADVFRVTEHIKTLGYAHKIESAGGAYGYILSSVRKFMKSDDGGDIGDDEEKI